MHVTRGPQRKKRPRPIQSRLHGNTDSPDGTIALLAAAMEGAGYLVERPEMCWSYRRKRDQALLECLAELEAPIARLTGRGARAIVVAGMSVGP
jgi:hypothetical protein